eukprot:2400307-Pyramimonas_sp.AAC.1
MTRISSTRFTMVNAGKQAKFLCTNVFFAGAQVGGAQVGGRGAEGGACEGGGGGPEHLQAQLRADGAGHEPGAHRGHAGRDGGLGPAVGGGDGELGEHAAAGDGGNGKDHRLHSVPQQAPAGAGGGEGER